MYSGRCYKIISQHVKGLDVKYKIVIGSMTNLNPVSLSSVLVKFSPDESVQPDTYDAEFDAIGTVSSIF